MTASGGDYRLVVVARRAGTARIPRGQVTRVKADFLPGRLFQYRLAAIRPQMSERSLFCLPSWTFRSRSNLSLDGVRRVIIRIHAVNWWSGDAVVMTCAV